MAMLRVSSYRKLFEDDSWSRNGGLSMQCAGQYRATVRSAAVDKCDCDKLDFVAAKAINKGGSEPEDKLNSRQAFSSITSTVPDYSLDEVVERLRRERDEILCDTEELRKELECLMKEYEKAAQQRILFQQERQDVAEEVDAVTAGCLALREQVAIYEEQLANMEAQHETAVEDLLEPADGTTGTVAAIKFGSPDITPALDVKEYYCQLAENLQYECDAPSFAVVRSSDGKQLEAGGACRVNSESLAKDNGHRKEESYNPQLALHQPSAPKSDVMVKMNGFPQQAKGSAEQLSDSRATVWEILLTRVFTLRTLSAGDVKGSASAQTGFIAFRVLGY
ncbi:hypothetical protein D5F01_LYC15374 [Larimichthys crocea]|uniref:IF rod domain-containing protein n=1 Tax=Larimichthys crocea TaxID=215358 RepID=A0A6G0I2Y5_LARCR|nr:hypothetical protein D5F01_LYC15374 [Larimichthys crocea]